MRLYGLCKTGNLGVFVCRWGHRSRRYRRLCSRLLRLCLSAKVPEKFFNEAGELQGRAMPESKLKLLIPHQSALAYFV
jgi:hypothetical protein